MKNIIPDYRLDMVGEPCPYPAVATLEAMPSLQKGEILEVVSDCPQSISRMLRQRNVKFADRHGGQFQQHQLYQ
ncbi:sulfurtransferase-like selenium metabolism protein YedF, partial [Klebsiella pneumoniae]|uniref:sulfurtransferase-like selenium metabolism protein YedF n=1 Tax=Klebsiella pneumoniae TaxID=573 RepID=UPI001D180EB0